MRYRQRIADALTFTPGDCWVEIGAGHGEMSVLLAKRAHRLIAIELDERLVSELRQKLAAFPNAIVLAADFLRVDLRALAEQAGTGLRVFGNLPYYITTPILKHLFAAAPAIAEATILVQREVAERLAARPATSSYGALTVFTRYHATPDLLFDVPPGAFRPWPEVSSTLVRLRLPGAGARLALVERERFFAFVRECFRNKRKTLLNNLRSRYGQRRVAKALDGLSLSPRARAEELTVEQLAALSHLLAG